MRLMGKNAVVTGAGRGIGKAVALKLAREGANTAVCDINPEEAERTCREIKEIGVKSFHRRTNVADREDVERLFQDFAEKLGDIDILVNNAGINRDSMLHKMTLEQWDEVIAVNLTGTFNCTQVAVRSMRERNSGRIINISSVSWLGNIGQANYAASKAGVVGLTKTAARELARKNITVNAICPGFISTDMTRGVPPKVWDIMVSKIPAGKAGEPEDVANLIAFLASDEAAYITGEVIGVGGGMVI